jgi:thiamine-phosphate diphosphorylase
VTVSGSSEFPILHAVTDGAAVCRADFVAVAGRAMTEIKSRLAIHLRAPMIPGKMFYDLAEELAQLQRDFGSWLIVNDRVDVAAAVGAKGVQLTSRSLSVKDAKKVAGDIPVGASVHSLEDAIAAYDAGASWCVAGNVFPTETHPGTPGKRIQFISLLASAVPIPIIAIGGVKPEHVSDLLDAGAYGIATIRGSGWNAEKTVLQDEPMRTVLDANRHSAGTVLVGRARSSPATPLSNYIWEYDAHRSRAQRDLPDGQRNTPGSTG